jgi:hypothetical protein
MAQITVTSTPQVIVLSSGTDTIQNLDATVPIYFSTDPQVSASGARGGFRLDPAIPWDFPTDRTTGVGLVYVVCAGGQSAVLAYGSF